MVITRMGAVYQRQLDDGREVCVIPRIYNTILTIGQASDEDGYTTHYCYESPVQATAAAEAWNPVTEKEPTGWFRHADTGRRRPHGDPELEYINV